MRKTSIGICLMLLGAMVLPACSTADWETAAPLIENVSTIAATIAFAQPDVAEHKAEICEAVAAVTGVLENYDDPDATFASVRQVALDAVRNLPADVLSDELKPLVITIVDTVLNTAWLYAKDSYSDLVNQDEVRMVLLVSSSVAKGINTACGPVTQGVGLRILDK